MEKAHTACVHFSTIQYNYFDEGNTIIRQVWVQLAKRGK